MKIITGRTGEHHVYASDDAELYRLFLGDGDYVLPTGSKFDARLQGTNQLDVYDGSLIMQGRLAKIRTGFDTLTFDNGTVGYKRVDLVVAEYNQTITEKEVQVEDPETHEIITVTQEDKLEDVTLKVVKGENVKDTQPYVEPEIETGDIDAGETHQMKLYAVRFDGINNDGVVSYIDGQLLTETPYNTLIATTLAAKAQADEMVQDMLGQVAEIAGKISTGAVLYCEDALLKDVKVEGEDKYSVPVIGYEHEAGDTIEVYINGIKLTGAEYTVTFATDAIVVEYVIAYGDTDSVEVVIRR